MSITSHIAEFRIVWIVQFVMTGNLQRSDRRKSIWCSSVPYRLRLKARYRQFPSPATCSGTWFPSKSGLTSWCIAVAVRSLCPRSTAGSGWCATQWVSSDSFSWPITLESWLPSRWIMPDNLRTTKKIGLYSNSSSRNVNQQSGVVHFWTHPRHLWSLHTCGFRYLATGTKVGFRGSVDIAN